MRKHFDVAKEEMVFYGTDNTSLQNLLAVIIGSKATAVVTGQLAALGVKGISSLSKEELLSYEGVGEGTANRILASLGLAGLMSKHQTNNKIILRSPEDAANVLSDLTFHDQEHFEALFLNTKNVVIGRKTVFKGSLNTTIVHPREVFKEAIKLSAASVIVGHNHPSGDPSPSREDIEVTKRLVEVGKMVGIEVLDHIIVGQNRHVSLKEKGYV